MASVVTQLLVAALLLCRGLAVLVTNREQTVNLCMHGRHAPELFLIGAQKAGTTSLFTDLLQNDRLIKSQDDFTGQMGPKELRFFSSPTRYANGSQFLVSHYPPCSQERKVAIDATPQIHAKFALNRIAETYLTDVHKLKFALLLREPVRRTHSAFHHGLRNHWGKLNDLTPTFSVFVDYVISDQGAQDLELKRGNIWLLRDSNYTGQLQNFFSLFQPSQLLVAPMQLYLHRPQGVLPLAHAISEWIGLPMMYTQSSNAEGAPRKNVGHSTPPDQELTTKQLDSFTNVIYNYTGPCEVARLLARDQVYLYGLKDNRAEGDIETWLRNGW